MEATPMYFLLLLGDYYARRLLVEEDAGMFGAGQVHVVPTGHKYVEGAVAVGITAGAVVEQVTFTEREDGVRSRGSIEGTDAPIRVQLGVALLGRAGGRPVIEAGTDEHAVTPAPQVERVTSGRVRLRWDARSSPMVMVRDAGTGEVLSLARGGDVEVSTSASRLELVLSDGVKSRKQQVLLP